MLACCNNVLQAHIFIQTMFNLVTTVGGAWCISGKGLTAMKENFLWPGRAEVSLLGNGRGVTEGIPELATKGRHFDLSGSSSRQHAGTHQHTNKPQFPVLRRPALRSQLAKRWRRWGGGGFQLLHSGCGVGLERRREQWRRTPVEG